MKKIVLFLAAALLIFTSGSIFAGEENLYPQLSRMPQVRAFVAPVKDFTEGEFPDSGELSRILKEGLQNRKSINFLLVDSASGADIIIRTDIMDYQWRKNDPIDKIAGFIGIGLDLVLRNNFAKLTGRFSVEDAGTGTVLWEKKLSGSVTRKRISKEESYPIVTKKLVRVFMRECFSDRRTKK